MRSTRLATVTAVLLIAAAAAPLAAAKPRGSVPPPIIVCQELLATGDGVWIADKEIEVGELSGLINGAFYLQYDDEGTSGIEPTAGPNLVITTKSGTLEVWLYGESTPQEDGSWNRKLATATVQGSGDYRDAAVDLALTGVFYPEKGGGYQLTGSLCAASKLRNRR